MSEARDSQGIRGNEISIVFQEPMTSLNPLHTIEQQIGEILQLHSGPHDGAKAARARIVELLDSGRHSRARRRGLPAIRINCPAASGSG